MNLEKYGKAGIPLLLIVPLVLVMLWIYGTGEEPADDPNAPKAYAYGTTIASNGMELHYLRTRPSNVSLVSIRSNVTSTTYYGINGGFFYQDDLLSIAVVNDRPVNAIDRTYGGGASNVKYPRGTLVWDGQTDSLSVQVVSEVADLRVADRANYWAQGGISMSLGQEERWVEQAALEHAPFADEDRLRSAAVFDRQGNLYIVVSSTKGTLNAFREAIIERIGNGALADGVFLDGDGSSQLRSRETKLQGDGRPVVQMLKLIQ